MVLLVVDRLYRIFKSIVAVWIHLTNDCPFSELKE